MLRNLARDSRPGYRGRGQSRPEYKENGRSFSWWAARRLLFRPVPSEPFRPPCFVGKVVQVTLLALSDLFFSCGNEVCSVRLERAKPQRPVRYTAYSPLLT